MRNEKADIPSVNRNASHQINSLNAFSFEKLSVHLTIKHANNLIVHRRVLKLNGIVYRCIF